ncbi:DNA-binding transcription factor [Lithospermum erythrorhizon]|uniref:DNA-binding transcription factor n=1 Tax=Lithospermum erythrorhizon TaxID=34254 RepID=A0AAV3RW07_LITER
MSIINQNSSSCSASEYDPKYENLDEKKRKRMISNRESARRSRMRKQKKLHDLTAEVRRLHTSNNDIIGKINGISEKYMIVAAENNVLKAQERELAEKLMTLNNMIVSIGLVVDDTQVPDPLMKPWEFPCSMQAIPSSSTFQF